MKFRLVLLLLVAAIVTCALAGCNGAAPGLDPSASVTVNGGNTSKNIPSGTSVALLGSATVVDTTNNPVVSMSWSQSTDTSGGSLGTFLNNSNAPSNTTSPYTSSNNWLAPTNTPTTGENIYITLTVKTLLKGSASYTTVLNIQPASGVPIFAFLNSSTNQSNVYYYLSGIKTTFTGSVPGGTQLYLGGTPMVGNVVYTDPLLFQWAEVPSGISYAFDHPNTQDPIWTAPASQYTTVTTPSGSTVQVLVPQTFYLSVTLTTQSGSSSTSYLVVVVN
jgi:hypothetical protein